MRLLFTQETDWLKRNPAQQHHLAEMLSLRGHEVRVIDYEFLWRTQGKKELYSRREVFSNVSKIRQDAGITIIRPGIVKLPLLDYISLVVSHRGEIAHQLNEFKPDCIVGWGILNSFLAVKEAKRNNIPLLYYWIDALDRLIPFPPFRVMGRLVESSTLKKSDKVLTINNKLRDYVIALGASPERTGVLRAGIDIEQYNPADNGSAVREQYGIQKDDVVLFFMGWLYQFSGLKEVALQLARVNNYNLKLLVVGEGDAYEDLQRIREEYNLQDRLILTGKKPYREIPSLIAAADVCLLPAYPRERIMQDIVPIKMYEYMAMKKPVISTSLPGVMEEFGEGNGAVELYNTNNLAKLGTKARDFVKGYSWDRVTDEFEEILKEVIEEKQSERLPERV